MSTLDDSPLGSSEGYTDTYTPSLLFSIPRQEAREAIFSGSDLPFFGEDVWTAYEFSWLGEGGKPEVAGLRIRVPCSSSHLVESKSVKLYLNSYAQTRFASLAEVRSTLESDLRLAVRAPVDVAVIRINQLMDLPGKLPGTCVDDADVAMEHYRPDASLLAIASDTVVGEALHTHLFRSVCPVTGQPDWASVLIEYRGRAISKPDLLRYLVSFRRHAAFHEATIEQIFVDVMAHCAPQDLSVTGLFQRRGGVDINPQRSTAPGSATLYRTARQ